MKPQSNKDVCEVSGTRTDQGLRTSVGYSPRSWWLQLSLVILVTLATACTSASVTHTSTRTEPEALLDTVEHGVVSTSLKAKRAVTSCEEEREAAGRPTCSARAQCLRVFGAEGTICQCSSPYTGNGTHCEAILCQPPQYPVRPHNGIISSPPQSYYQPLNRVTISCLPGYRRLGEGRVACGWDGEWARPYPICADEDECAANRHNCTTLLADGSVHPTNNGTMCSNTVGSFTCECKRGFARINYSMCQEVTCSTAETILNGNCFYRGTRVGDRRVVDCNEGYHEVPGGDNTCQLNGRWSPAVCADKDECSLGAHGCRPEQVCMNMPGSYMCVNTTRRMAPSVRPATATGKPSPSGSGWPMVDSKNLSTTVPVQPMFKQNWAGELGNFMILVLVCVVVASFAFGALTNHYCSKRYGGTSIQILQTEPRRLGLNSLPNNWGTQDTLVDALEKETKSPHPALESRRSTSEEQNVYTMQGEGPALHTATA